MKISRLKIWLIILMTPAYLQSYAQIDVFDDEIENRNGITYYANQPLTGTVYSNDEEEIPNNCQCSLKAHYTNGLLDGEKLQFFKNGKLKFKGSYQNGKATGTHLKYDKNGQVIQKTSYKTGEPVESNYYDKGEVVKKDIFHNGKLEITQEFEHQKLIKQTSYYPDKIEVVEYFENGKPKVKAYYKNQHKTGQWTYYDENGQKISEKIYNHDELLGEGAYKNGKKDGVWYQYSPDKKIKTIHIYQSGKLIKTKTENSAYAIKNYNFKPGEIVLTEADKINGDTYYYAWNPMIKPADHPDIKRLKKVITNLVRRHADMTATDLSPIGDQNLSYRFEIHDASITYKTLKHQRTRTVNGTEQKYYENEHLATAEFKIYVYPVSSNDIADIMNFSASSEGNLATGILTAALGAYPKNREEALNRLLKHINIYKLAVKYFPAYTRIASIKSQNSKKIKAIKTDRGMFDKVYKGAYFRVYDEDTGTFRALIRIYKAESNFAFGKVKKDGDWLKNYIIKQPQPWLKEVYPK